MKVVILHGSNDVYGAAKVVLQDVQVLTGLGHEVAVVLPYDGPLTACVHGAGGRVVIQPMRVLRRVQPLSAAGLPLAPPSVVRGADVVVLSTLALLTYLPALMIRRIPMVLSVHELLPGRAGSLLARLAGVARVPVMTNSHATRRWLMRHGVRGQRIRMAYPAAPAIAKRRNGGLKHDDVHVLVAGRVNAGKGHPDAVEAVSRVRATGTNAQLTLLGAPYPGQEQHLETLLEMLHGRPWARYVGEVADLTPWFLASDVLLIPSTRPESFGLVALEAWAAGCHVVAPNEGGAAEAAGLVNGHCFKPRDTHSMAGTLERLVASGAHRSPPSTTAPASRECTLGRRRQAWEELLP